MALPLLLCLLFAAPLHAQSPALIWAKQFDGGGTPSAYALALRSTKLWVSGTYNTSINLGGASYTSPQNSFLALFNTDGVYQWSHAFNVGGGIITAMGADTGDNIYITGQFDGTVDFGGGPLTSMGGYDILLAKFNSVGVLQWSKRFGDIAGTDSGGALAIDNSNNVIIGGKFGGTVDFGGGPLTTAGGTDAFIAKFNSAGTIQWSKKFGDATNQQVDALASSNGDIYAAGSFFGGINLGGSLLTSVGLNDIFLARFNSAGTHQWSSRFGDSASQTAVEVDADVSSVVLLAGIQGTVNFGGTPLFTSGGDVAVARFTTGGTHVWSKAFGDSDSQSAAALDLAGNSVFVTGWFEGAIAFGRTLSAGTSSSDAFVARLSSADGSEVWSQHFGYNVNSDWGFDVVSDGAQTFLGGRFEKDLNLGYHGVLFSADRTTEAYLAKFGSFGQEPLIRSIEDVDNDQGGKVRVRFDESDYDKFTTPVVIRNYEVYLREDALNTARSVNAAAGETWILAGQAPAHGLVNYYTLAFTQQDSTLATGMHTSVFKVRATTDDPAVYFDSPTLGGYSLDNLAPSAPLNFVLAGGELSWQSGGDQDVAYYSVYGSAGAFDEAAELVEYTSAPRLDVSARPFAHYYVTATDRAGNEGKPASLATDRSGAPQIPRTLSVSAYPNPFNPATTIRYTLPTSGRVRVDVFDATGARVRALVEREQPPGVFTVRWDGHDDTGRAVASGIYFARVEHDGKTRAYKLVMLK
jgi:hypothetical protein